MNKRNKGYLFFLIIVLFFLQSSIQAKEFNIAVASNFKPTLTSIVNLYKKKNKHTDIHIISGATGTLVTQIINGAPFDILFTADNQSAQVLAEQQKADAQYRNIYALGELVLWSKNEKTRSEALSNICQHSLMIGNPKISPYGQVAQNYIQTLKLTCQPSMRLANNIAQAFQLVNLGHVDLAFLPKSLLILAENKQSMKGRYWSLYKDKTLLIEQEVVVLNHKNKETAKVFFNWFNQSHEVAQLIQASGYQVVQKK